MKKSELRQIIREEIFEMKKSKKHKIEEGIGDYLVLLAFTPLLTLIGFDLNHHLIQPLIRKYKRWEEAKRDKKIQDIIKRLKQDPDLKSIANQSRTPGGFLKQIEKKLSDDEKQYLEDFANSRNYSNRITKRKFR